MSQPLQRPISGAAGLPRTSWSFWSAFYRDQARLMWTWRATRLALARRALLSWLGSALALWFVASVSPNLSLGGLDALLLAALLLSVLNGLVRPGLLLLLSPLPTFALPLFGLLVEVPIVLAIGWLIPGVQVASLMAAVWDALALVILNAVLAEILRTADDDSYFGSQVRQLAGRAFGRPLTREPGLLMIQLDGLSLPVLENQMRAGRMPTLDGLMRSGEYKLDPWWAMLPPVTPASQAGILHGNNDEMPGFRWFEKRTGTVLVANTPEGASEMLRQRSDGRGLLANDGASIGNLLTGDAARCYLTMSTIAEPRSDPDDPRRLRGIFVSNVNYLRLLVLTIGDVLKEFYQRERQRGRHVRPRIERNLHYAIERALTNVSLRNLTTALVIEEMFNRAPAIYVDYTGYDCLAHHAGPERQEAVDALAGLDRTLGSVLRAAAEAPRDYRIVVLSDHGQCLSTPFSQRFGQELEQLVRGLMGLATLARLGPSYGEYRGLGRMVLGEMGRGPGIRRAVARRAARQQRAGGKPVEVGDLVVCASGNLALIYFTCSDQRMDRDELDERYPALIAGLVEHPGVELVLVHSATVGPQVLSRTGELDLRSGRFSGLDPLEPFGPRARASLQRLDGFSNTGDVVLIGPFEPSTGEVVSYEDLVGSHGGLGGWQEQPFLLHPVSLTVDRALDGAPAVHQQLRRWLVSLEGADARAADAARPDARL